MLLLALGLAALLVSTALSVAFGILIVWIIVFAGLAYLVHAWDVRGTQLFAWRLMVGVVYVGGGLYLVLHPRYDLAFLTLFIAWMFSFESLLLLGAYGWLRRQSGSRWIAVDAVSSLIIALLIGLLWQRLPLWLLGVLVGLNILCTGGASLALAAGRRRLSEISGGVL